MSSNCNSSNKRVTPDLLCLLPSELLCTGFSSSAVSKRLYFSLTLAGEVTALSQGYEIIHKGFFRVWVGLAEALGGLCQV